MIQSTAAAHVELLLPLALSQPQEALVQARAVLLTAPGPAVASFAHQAAGIVLRDHGRLAAGLEELRKALRCARSARLDDRVADVLATYGAAQVMAGHTRSGLRYLDDAATLAHGDLLAKVRLRQAHSLSLIGRHHDALRELQRALKAVRRSSDPLWEARILNNRCLAHLAVGASGRAEADALRAEQMFSAIGQKLELVHATHNRGLIAFQRGDLPAAMTLLDAAGARYRDLGVPMPDLVIDQARVSLTAGLAAEGVEALKVALASDDLQPIKRGELLLFLATAELAAGHPELARDRADRAGRLFRAQDRPRWEDRAAFVSLHSRYLEGRRDATLLTAIHTLAGRLVEFRADEAPLAYLLAGRLALDRGAADMASISLTAAAKYRRSGPALNRATGWLAAALQISTGGADGRLLIACRRGLDALDEHRLTFGAAELRALATGHGRELGSIALTQALRGGSSRTLLSWSERWRATALASPPVRAPQDAELATELAALREAVRRIDEARENGAPTIGLERERKLREAAVRRRRMHLRGGGKGTSRGGERAASAFDVDALLTALEDARLVTLVDVEGSLYAVVAADGRVRRCEVGSVAAAIAETEFAQFTLRQAAHGRRPDTTHLGARLQHVLLGSAAKWLGTGPTILVPPASLHGAPWSLLPALAEVPLSASPSASLWLRTRNNSVPREHRVILVVGPGLVGGDAEVSALKKTHVGASVYRDRLASVDRVLSGLDGVWLAHIAAHGSFRADSPSFSSLALVDGPLTVHDLDRLRQPPYRVLLSACDSGVGAAVGADELLGFVTGLLALGTTGILASVAPVHDEAAVPFMLAVHDGLKKGQNLPEACLSARQVAVGDGLGTATAASFTAWGS